MGRTTEELLDRYELYARAAGFSRAQVDHMRSCVGSLDQFLQGIEDIKEVTADDFRRFLADLRDRPLWRGMKTEQARHPERLQHQYLRTRRQGFLQLAEGRGHHC